MQDSTTAPAVVDDIEVEESGQPVALDAPVQAAPVDAVDPGDEDDGGAQLDAVADETQPEQTEPDAPKVKPRNSIQAKIDQAIARQREAERRAEAAERELQTYRAPKQPVAEKPKAEPQYTRPRPTEDAIGTKYQTYADYVEDLTDWKIEQREHQHKTQEQERAVREWYTHTERKFVSQLDAAVKADPKYWSKINPHVANVPPMSDLGRLIFESDYATQLMLKLSELPAEEFQRLSTLHPVYMAREMGRLEASVMRSTAASPGPASKSPAVSQAPPPYKPVGTTASAASETDLDPDDMSEEAIKKHFQVMNARDKRGRFTGR